MHFTYADFVKAFDRVQHAAVSRVVEIVEFGNAIYNCMQRLRYVKIDVSQG